MSDDLALTVRIMADAGRYASGLQGGLRDTGRFADGVRRQLDGLRGTFTGLRGQLAMLGGGFTALKLLQDSARLDKGLVGIKLTAEASRGEMLQLRQDLFRMAQESGRSVEDLQAGFNNLVQAGESWQAARQEIEATNVAMAVTGARAEVLTAGLSVAGEAFQFDLAKPGMAMQLLDKMAVAGRRGNAELENLSAIFGRVGPSAASAGLGFDKTLAFIEGLSLMERQPERLATLADSTLRLFNNLNYMKDAAKATKVKFFNADGSRRDALAVIGDMRKQYRLLKTDKERALYLQKAFGKADLDTIKGMKILLSGDVLDKIHSFSRDLGNAAGTLKRDMREGIGNAIDQVGRLKAALRETADGFAQPINDTLSNVIGFLLDGQDKGGLGLEGKELVIGGATIAGSAVAGGYVLRWLSESFGKKLPLAGKVLPGMGSLAGLGVGVATGKALQAAAGVTPVFVVNMPEGLGGGGPAGKPPVLAGGAAGGGAMGGGAAGAGGAAAGAATGTALKSALVMAGGLEFSRFLALGPSAWLAATLGVGAAGAAGYGFGSLVYNMAEGTRLGDGIVEVVGGGLARLLGLFGNENAQQAVALTEKLRGTDLGGTVKIVVESPDGVQARVQATPASPGLRYQVGETMRGER